MDKLYLEKSHRFEICLAYKVNDYQIKIMKEEAEQLKVEMAISNSRRIIMCTAAELQNICGILEVAALWPDVLNIKEIKDYTPSWQLNEDLYIEEDFDDE